jgi:PAS domain-containing protein
VVIGTRDPALDQHFKARSAAGPLGSAPRRGNDRKMCGQKSLPLILARELAANLATPMFLLDAQGMLVFYNDAAALLLGKPFGELGEIPASEFGAVLQLTTPDGEPIRRRDSPAGVALFEQRPAHKTLMATAYNGVRRVYDATAYPLFAAEGEMHGVVAVFWESNGVGDEG